MLADYLKNVRKGPWQEFEECQMPLPHIGIFGGAALQYVWQKAIDIISTKHP